MGSINLSLVTLPDVTAYDGDFPTRSTELYANCLHNILKSMDDSGDWYFNDGIPTLSDLQSAATNINAMNEDAWDYASSAIINFRDHGTPDLIKPDNSTIVAPIETPYPWLQDRLVSIWTEANKICWVCYYMWETEEDPLRIQDYIRDMMLAWPLNDIEIQLNEEAGKSLRVYPVWKDADI